MIGDTIALIVGGALSYLLGAVPFGYVYAKVFAGVDIRQVGSQNVGATNVFRGVGKLPGALTLISDIAKGIIVVLVIAPLLYHWCAQDLDFIFYQTLLGFLAIAGHIWPVFLKFKGGKGVATTIGIVAAIAPSVLTPGLLTWVALFSITNFVSVASIGLGIALPVVSALMHKSIFITIFTACLCLLNTYKHRTNIIRLIRREERKTFLFKKSYPQ